MIGSSGLSYATLMGCLEKNIKRTNRREGLNGYYPELCGWDLISIPDHALPETGKLSCKIK